MTASEARNIARSKPDTFSHPVYDRIHKWIIQNAKDKKYSFYWLGGDIPSVVLKRLRIDGFLVRRAQFQRSKCWYISWEVETAVKRKKQ